MINPDKYYSRNNKNIYITTIYYNSFYGPYYIIYYLSRTYLYLYYIDIGTYLIIFIYEARVLHVSSRIPTLRVTL